MEVLLVFGLVLVCGIGWTASRFGRGGWVWPKLFPARGHIGLNATEVDRLALNLGNRETK